MKIEKINDHKIRCTLTREDLAKWNIDINHLEYGTPEAHQLFSDMMKQASEQYGFFADDTPVSVEAIPSEHDSVILIITTDADTDEIDTTFSTFSPDIHDIRRDITSDRSDDISSDIDYDNPDSTLMDGDESDDEHDDEHDDQFGSMSDVANLFRSLQGNLSPEDSASLISNEFKMLQKKTDVIKAAPPAMPGQEHAYRFNSLNELIRISSAISKIYGGINCLYKQYDFYILILSDSSDTSKVDSLLSEYSQILPLSQAGLSHIEEHGTLIIRDNAIQRLALMSK